jgi:hypothetical protein
MALYFCTISHNGMVLMGGHWLAPNAAEARLLARRAYLDDYKRLNYPVIELCEERARKSNAPITNALNAPVDPVDTAFERMGINPGVDIAI